MGLPCHRTSRRHSTSPAGAGGLRSQDEELSIALSVRTDQPNALSRVRAVVKARLESWAVPDALEDDIVLCLSELLSNVLRHVTPPFCVLLLEDGPTVRLTVTDASPDLPVVKTAAGTALKESGRGMVLVAAVASRWGASPTAVGGKDVWAEFDRRGAGLTVCGEGTVRWSA